nr:unnamed protein product [Digitaria exilis]
MAVAAARMGNVEGRDERRRRGRGDWQWRKKTREAPPRLHVVVDWCCYGWFRATRSPPCPPARQMGRFPGAPWLRLHDLKLLLDEMQMQTWDVGLHATAWFYF